MTTPNSIDAHGAAPRRRGAPKGNRNAWKHGQRSAAAKAEREAARTALLARLPDSSLFVRIAERSEPELKRLGWDVALAEFRSNKTNNSISRGAEGEGDPPPNFSENKTNNSVAHGSTPAQRGRGTTRSVVEGAPASAPLPACGGTPPALREEGHNFVAREGPRRRGAPKGNRNALKHGFHSGKRRDFDSGLRQFIRRLNAMCKLAHAMASAGRAG